MQEQLNEIKKENNVTEKLNKEGHSSRTRKVLIEEAILNCNPDDKFNRFKILEQLALLMDKRYKGDNLDYHSKRMGMPTTLKMLEEIDLYFYKDYK